ncbi:hypothetical protein [Pantoea agglomerans]|uniref:hypothetical protein n=1 Tax=Enterobacter agglomerans TaxID=549 RepID=UPI003C79A248
MAIKATIEEIESVMHFVLNKSNKKEGACLYMGAMLYSLIHENFHLTPKFVAGSLRLNKDLIFSHEPILPVMTAGQDFSGYWGGHAWVEIENYILDPSFFYTIYSDATPSKLQEKVKKTFNGRFDFLIGSRTRLEESGLFYKPYEELSDYDATTLIKSGYSAGFLND